MGEAMRDNLNLTTHQSPLGVVARKENGHRFRERMSAKSSQQHSPCLSVFVANAAKEEKTRINRKLK